MTEHRTSKIEYQQRAVQRIQQLSVEIEIGLNRGDLDLVHHAVSLLDSALERCRALNAIGPESDCELVAAAADTCARLDVAAARLVAEMSAMTHQMHRLKRGRQALARKRSSTVQTSSRRLDTRL